MDAIKLRNVMLANLDDLGFGKALWLGERLLFENRLFVGIRFDFEGVSAIWPAEGEEIRFVAESGKLLRAVPVPSNAGLPSKAA